MDFIEKLKHSKSIKPELFKEWLFLATFNNNLDDELKSLYKYLYIKSKEEILKLYSIVIERQRLGAFYIKGEVTFEDNEASLMNFNRFIRFYNKFINDCKEEEKIYSENVYIDIISQIEVLIGLEREFNIVLSLYKNDEVTLNISDKMLNITNNESSNEIYKSLQESIIHKENMMYLDEAKKMIMHDVDKLESQGKRLHPNMAKSLDVLSRASDASITFKDKYDQNGFILNEEEVYDSAFYYYCIRDKYYDWNEYFLESLIPKLEGILPEQQIKWAKKVVNKSLVKMKYNSFVSLVKKIYFKCLQRVPQNINIDEYIYDWDDNNHDLIDKIDYPFIKINSYIYINKSILHGINIADRIFSIFMETASKDEISKYSNEFERQISDILKKYGYKSYSSKKVFIDNKPIGEFDFIGYDDKSVILGEVKISSFKNNFSHINTWSASRIEQKATSQLEKLKFHIENNQLKSFFENLNIDISNKEIIYVIYSCVPDGIFLTDNFLSVNKLLLDELLSTSMESGKSIYEIYQDFRENIELQPQQSRNIEIGDMKIQYVSHY